MSCGSPDNTADRLCAVFGGAGLLSAFYADISTGLHAVAQPLTILRGALGALAMRDGVKPECARYLEMSTTQTERLCTLISCLQKRLDAEQSKADRVTVNISELIASIMPNLKTLAKFSGVEIAVAQADSVSHFCGDSARTEEALQAVLQSAISVSSPGDVICLLVIPGDCVIQLIIENSNSHGKRLSSFDLLTLSVAEANIRIQEGTYAYVDDPLRISIELPVHLSRADGAEAGFQCGRAIT